MTARDFRRQVLQVFYQDVHRIVPDNYAWERFSADGVDRSSTFDLARHVMFLEWFGDQYERIHAAYEKLADDASRALLVSLLRYRLSGHNHVRIDSSVPLRAAEVQRFKEIFAGTPSTIGKAGMFGALQHYDQEWRGIRYVVDTVKDSLVYPLVYRQYFFERGAVRIQAEVGDHVVDGGAFTGDSACVFSRIVGPNGRVYTFDPVENHLEMIRANLARPGYENVVAFGSGLSDKTVEAPPVRIDEYHPGWSVGDGVIPLVRIDDLLIDGRVPRVDFVKLDVEGSELAALRGALAAIHHFRPRLAISIYHKPNDYFEILEFLEAQNLGYRFYIDHYTSWDEETVLYATVT